jgi:hypothetical protein
VALERAGGGRGDCRLPADALAVALPTTATKSDEDLGIDDGKVFVRGTRTLAGVLLRSVVDCLCQAAVPECRPCDDPGVLLACVTVQGCQVVEICNLTRTFVLSPTAVRYWLPPITWLGRLIEEACCTLAKLAAAPEDAAPAILSNDKVRFVADLALRPSVRSLAAAGRVFYDRPIDARTVTAAVGGLASLAALHVPRGVADVVRAAVRGDVERASMAALEERLREQEDALRTLSERLDRLTSRGRRRSPEPPDEDTP